MGATKDVGANVDGPMLRTWCCLLLSLLFFLPPCRATSIVYVVSETGDYVVLAAESRDLARVLDPRYGKMKSTNESCKVIDLDGTLFFNSGNVRIAAYRGPDWRSLQTAQKVYKTSTEHGAQALSIAWANEVMKWFYSKDVRAIQSIADADGGLVTGGFINFDSQRNPEVFLQTLYFKAETRELSRQPTSALKGQVGVAGIHREWIREFEKADTPRALKAYGTLQTHNVGRDLSYDIVFVQKAVQFVIDNVSGKEKESVHGPIDVVVIRRFGGVDWVTRKPNCYSQDFHPKPQKKSPIP